MNAVAKEIGGRTAIMRHPAHSSYLTQMLRELHRQAAEVDWTLAYMIEMAATHSYDIDLGSTIPKMTP